MSSYKPLFSKALASNPERLHFAAHSHHLWPDVTLDAQIQCWTDAVQLADRKWDKVFGEVYPGAQANVLAQSAERIDLLPLDPADLASVAQLFHLPCFACSVCTGGTGCSNGDSRALADFFQVALDTQHRANIAFSDDHLASPLCSSQSPGHCGNRDPLAFPVAVPYFTYQVKADKKIVTTGVCAR